MSDSAESLHETKTETNQIANILFGGFATTSMNVIYVIRFSKIEIMANFDKI